MNSKKNIAQLKVISRIANINGDFLQLILCMFVSHYILNNSLYGAALFLFASIWTLYFQGNLRQTNIKRNNTGTIMWVLLIASIIAGLAVIFIYPAFIKNPHINYVTFFVLMVIARDIITYRINYTYSHRKRKYTYYKAAFQFLFLIPCAIFAFYFFEGASRYILIVVFLITGFLLSYQNAALVNLHRYIHKINDKMYNISSYGIFTNMSLYSKIAFSLGMLMYICYVSFTEVVFTPVTYIIMMCWLVMVIAASEFISWIVKKRNWILSLNLFIIGALLWIFGSVKMFDADKNIIEYALWTLFWGFGLACINAVLNSFNNDFKLIARIANKRVEDKELYYRNLLLQVVAIIISNCIMLCVLTFWSFVIPEFSEPELPRIFKSTMIQLPVLFMLISIFFALRQPLDERSREKLSNYYKGTNQNKPTKQNLKKRFVYKYRVRFGVKIMVTFVRPFLHLKVTGKENIDAKNYPSVFICNHGIFYGPVAAVIYLPTYFRPWIDKKMVSRELSSQEMYKRFIYRIPLLSVKAKKWIAYKLSKPVVWALNSFNPIPVERDNLRNILSTFNDTVEVLAEGDNVLIFPERPKKVTRSNKETVEHETETVGKLFTGFASIGKMYFEKTGKALRFYPIYANKKSHTFRIGSPVIYQDGTPPKVEKQRIADELYNKMLTLRDIE